MAHSRFIRDTGLTVRMTTVMFLLGAAFVALIVGLMFVLPVQYAPFIAIAGIGIAFYQWWSSDKVAMRAMRAREVTPEEAPELHGMIDRLCAMADMPKPRVGVADLDIPNAFATGRSPQRSVVCVTTGILGMLTAEELEARAGPRAVPRGPPRRAGDDARLVGGHRRGHAHPRCGLGRVRVLRSSRQQQRHRRSLVALVLSLVVYAVSFLLLRLLSRYRELAADRAGAYLTMRPAALATALQKITGEMAAIPQRDLRASQAMNAFFIAPAISGATLKTLTATHPSLEQRLEQLARIQAELARPQQ